MARKGAHKIWVTRNRGHPGKEQVVPIPEWGGTTDEIYPPPYIAVRPLSTKPALPHPAMHPIVNLMKKEINHNAVVLSYYGINHSTYQTSSPLAPTGLNPIIMIKM